MSSIPLSSWFWMERENAQVARGLAKRDPATYDRLIAEYATPLRCYLISIVRDRVVADDLFQETWIRVLEKGSQYDGRTAFKTWLLTIAHNIAIDHFRRRQPRVLDCPSDHLSDDSIPEPRDQRPSPLEAAEREELSERITLALEDVPLVYREVVVLRFQQELSLAEIAQLLSIPLATVKSRLYRGVMALRAPLEGLRR